MIILFVVNSHLPCKQLMSNITDKNTSFLSNRNLYLGDNMLSLDNPIVMGILNITDDSFYDGGKYRSENEILKQTERMLIEGASIIDIGAVSTRPGAVEIPENKELEKLIFTIKSILKRFPKAIISIDTYRSNIADVVINEGAKIINDISGGTFDNNMFKLVAQRRIPYIMMHIKGTPRTMQNNPEYINVILEIKNFFINQINKLEKLGITNNIILDPGFGFGKTKEHNFEILKHLKSFCELGYPVMAGISRKSMIHKTLDINPDEALNGTTALNTLALLNGVSILRVHDVKEAMEAINLVKMYNESN